MYRVQGAGPPTSITLILTKILLSILCIYIHGYFGAALISGVQGVTLNLPKPYLNTTILLDVGIG